MGRNQGKPHAFRCQCGDHSWAILTRGYVVMVSPDDDHLLKAQKYSAIPKPPKNQPKSKVHDRVTACHSINGRGTVMIHREILKPETGVLVDHRNGNALDNRRWNLREASPSQNAANARKPRRNSSSQYKGVSWDSKNERWRAAYEHMGRNHFLGLFDCEAEAHRAYVAGAKAVWHEFARFS